MVFAVRDGQKWDGPGIPHPCPIPHWRLGGIPQCSSEGNKHSSWHNRVPPQGLCAATGRTSSKSWAQSQTECFTPQPLLKQKGLNSMFIINAKLFCSAWGKQTHMQGFYWYAKPGLAKVTVLCFCPLPAATFSNHTTSYQYEWSQSGLCCLQLLVFSFLSSSLNW